MAILIVWGLCFLPSHLEERLSLGPLQTRGQLATEVLVLKYKLEEKNP